MVESILLEGHSGVYSFDDISAAAFVYVISRV